MASRGLSEMIQQLVAQGETECQQLSRRDALLNELDRIADRILDRVAAAWLEVNKARVERPLEVVNWVGSDSVAAGEAMDLRLSVEPTADVNTRVFRLTLHEYRAAAYTRVLRVDVNNPDQVTRISNREAWLDAAAGPPRARVEAMIQYLRQVEAIRG